MSGIATIARHVLYRLPDLPRGLCRDDDPERFHPIGNSGPALLQIAEAKAVCLRCPALDACREYAIENPRESGVWGATDEDERRVIRQHRTKARHLAKKKAEKEVAV